jgi:transcriptional regulator with XRE-family HTH domain
MKATAKSADVLLHQLRAALPRYESKRHMARMIGVSEGTLNRWLNDATTPNPSLSELERIAAQLGVSVADLVSGDAPPLRPAVQGTAIASLIKMVVPMVDASSDVASLSARLLEELRGIERANRAVPARPERSKN